MSDTEKRLKLARVELEQIRAAHDEAAQRLTKIQAQEGLEAATVAELAAGSIPSAQAAAEALQELQRRRHDKQAEVTGLERTLHTEQAEELAGRYLVQVEALLGALAQHEEALAELEALRAEVGQLDVATAAQLPGVARLVAEVERLGNAHAVRIGERYSLWQAEPAPSMVLVDGMPTPRAEWEAQPRKRTKAEAIKSLFS